MLKPGYSLRFAFLPSGEDPDTFIRSHGSAAMRTMLEGAEPLSKVLWRAETEGKDFSTPERRAGLERSLAEIVQAIGDAKIADYYRRDFEQLVFDNFKRRQAPQRAPFRPGKPSRGDRGERSRYPTPVEGGVVASQGQCARPCGQGRGPAI